MSIDEFILWLQERYPDLTHLDEEEIRQSFGRYDGYSLEKVKTAIIDGRSYRTAPNVSEIKKLCAGISLKKTHSGIDQDYAYICKSCRTIYRGRIRFFDAYRCPVCGKETRNHSLVHKPKGKIYFVQDPCGCGWSGYLEGNIKDEGERSCPRYNPNHHGPSGPNCDSFGNYESIRGCESCLCRDCCKAFTREKETLQ
jgi:hypothetical protein